MLHPDGAEKRYFHFNFPFPISKREIRVSRKYYNKYKLLIASR